MIVKGELDELVDTLNDYSVYLKQFGYDIDTIFSELNVVQARASDTVH